MQHEVTVELSIILLLGRAPPDGGVGLSVPSPRHSYLVAVGFPLQSLTHRSIRN